MRWCYLLSNSIDNSVSDCSLRDLRSTNSAVEQQKRRAHRFRRHTSVSLRGRDFFNAPVCGLLSALNDEFSKPCSVP